MRPSSAAAVMIEQNAEAPAMLLGQRRLHAPPRFPAQRLEFARPALALRLVLHDELAIPRPPAVVGRPEGGEGSRLPRAAAWSNQGRQSVELDEPRLVLVQQQVEGGQTLSEDLGRDPHAGDLYFFRGRPGA